MEKQFKFKAWKPYEGYRTIAIVDDFEAIMWGLEHQVDIFTQDDELVYSPNDEEESNFERLAKYDVRCIDDLNGRRWERIEFANEEKLANLNSTNMKKYIAIGNCANEGELWFLVDAESLEQAKRIIVKAKGETFEINACVKVTTNSEAGISHEFKLFE